MKRYLYLKLQEGYIKSGHPSDVNSDGTNFSAFARIGAAAIFKGMSNSEKGSSGRDRSSLEDSVFFVEAQAKNKNSKGSKNNFFIGFPFE